MAVHCCSPWTVTYSLVVSVFCLGLVGLSDTCAAAVASDAVMTQASRTCLGGTGSDGSDICATAVASGAVVTQASRTCLGGLLSGECFEWCDGLVDLHNGEDFLKGMTVGCFNLCTWCVA